MSFRLYRYQTLYRHSEEEGGNLQKSFQGQSQMQKHQMRRGGKFADMIVNRKASEIRKHLDQIINKRIATVQRNQVNSGKII